MVRRYTDEDFNQIALWAKGWETSYSKELFPPIGFIVDNTAAYFLYTTPSKVCFMENMISNREASKEAVDKALQEIVEAICIEARNLGFEVAYACSNNNAVVHRALRNGCSVEPSYALITKKL